MAFPHSFSILITFKLCFSPITPILSLNTPIEDATIVSPGENKFTITDSRAPLPELGNINISFFVLKIFLRPPTHFSNNLSNSGPL